MERKSDLGIIPPPPQSLGEHGVDERARSGVDVAQTANYWLLVVSVTLVVVGLVLVLLSMLVAKSSRALYVSAVTLRVVDSAKRELLLAGTYPMPPPVRDASSFTQTLPLLGLKATRPDARLVLVDYVPGDAWRADRWSEGGLGEPGVAAVDGKFAMTLQSDASFLTLVFVPEA